MINSHSSPDDVDTSVKSITYPSGLSIEVRKCHIWNDFIVEVTAASGSKPIFQTFEDYETADAFFEEMVRLLDITGLTLLPKRMTQ